jgi:hypothetical protein
MTVFRKSATVRHHSFRTAVFALFVPLVASCAHSDFDISVNPNFLSGGDSIQVSVHGQMPKPSNREIRLMVAKLEGARSILDVSATRNGDMGYYLDNLVEYFKKIFSAKNDPSLYVSSSECNGDMAEAIIKYSTLEAAIKLVRSESYRLKALELKSDCIDLGVEASEFSNAIDAALVPLRFALSVRSELSPEDFSDAQALLNRSVELSERLANHASDAEFFLSTVRGRLSGAFAIVTCQQ